MNFDKKAEDGAPGDQLGEQRETLLVRQGDQYSDNASQNSPKSKEPSTSNHSHRLQVLQEEEKRRKEEQAALQTLQNLMNGKMNLGGLSASKGS